MQQYTNEITPEIRESFTQPPYDKDFLALCDSKTREALKRLTKIQKPAHWLTFSGSPLWGV